MEVNVNITFSNCHSLSICKKLQISELRLVCLSSHSSRCRVRSRRPPAKYCDSLSVVAPPHPDVGRAVPTFQLAHRAATLVKAGCQDVNSLGQLFV